VWPRELNPGSREHGGRTIPQKGGNWCRFSIVFDCTARPSDSRFRSITKDLRRLREMRSFALSRRQHGFESRWGHKIKSLLTRSNTSSPVGRRKPDMSRESGARSETATAALDVTALSAAWGVSCGPRQACFTERHWAGPRRSQQLLCGSPVAGRPMEPARRELGARDHLRPRSRRPPNASSSCLALRGSTAIPNGSRAREGRVPSQERAGYERGC
jgi:hypothetical protein